MLEIIIILKAIILGAVEGLTEFLPVSSTAHLVLVSKIINFNEIQNNVFEISIQLGAIIAIVVLYRKKIFETVLLIHKKPQQKFALNIITAFLPAALIGLLLHHHIKELFSNLTIGISLLVGGILMIAIDCKPRKSRIDELDNISPFTSFLIGLFQCLAMIPGVSRSGATIIGSMLVGLNRKTATEFSFFLAIPTIAAASIYDLFKNSSQLTNTDFQLIGLGMISSFISASLVIKWFVKFVSKNNFISFGIYRIFAGSLVLIFLT